MYMKVNLPMAAQLRYDGLMVTMWCFGMFSKAPTPQYGSALPNIII